MFGLDNDVAIRYQMRTTPQTILIREGRIVRSWGGVLSAQDVSEIVDAIAESGK